MSAHDDRLKSIPKAKGTAAAVWRTLGFFQVLPVCPWRYSHFAGHVVPAY